MAAAARSRGDAREAAPEKLQILADERFLAGDVAGALRVAREAQKRCRTPLPSSLAHALAAYEVHSAAAASGSGGTNWYAVLGFNGSGGVTREDIKRRCRRLCLVVHPDKNRSAAADGAFKLLQEAWDALSALHPPARPSAEQKLSNQSRQPPAAAGPKDSEKRRANNPPAGSEGPLRRFRSVYFARCSQEFRAPEEECERMKHCGRCQERLRNPRRHARTDVEMLYPGGENRSSSCPPGTCPAPGCGGQYEPCKVADDMWKLRCISCHHESGDPPICFSDLLLGLYTRIGSDRFTGGGMYWFR